MVLATLLVSTIFSLTPIASASQQFYPETIQAAGGTFVNPVMQVWATGFAQYTGGQVSVNYQPVGSGAGQTDIEHGVVAFAGSDAPLTAAQWAPYAGTYGPLLQFPETLGGVAIFYNIPGVSVSLNLTGDIIARIYLGNITMWNDPAIQALNPHVALPGNVILPVHRSDGSGTTYALTNYFEKTSSDWNASWTNGVISLAGCPCYATSISWPGFEIAAKGSAGVAAYVQQNPNTIGYADSYYAFSNGLKAAAVQNQAGQFLVPTIADIAAAAAAFSSQVQANPTFTITNAPGATSYPIATYTYLLVLQNQTNQPIGYDMTYFFLWIVNQGQAFGPQLYYPKLPANVVAIDEGIIQQIQYNGAPILTIAPVSVTCALTTVVVGRSTLCKATITGSLTKGKVTFSTIGVGNFIPTTSTCTVNIHTHMCSVRYYPTFTQSTVNITASYLSADGSTIGMGLQGITVVQKASTTLLSCVPASAAAGSRNITCTATVTAGYHPTGSVTFTQTAGPGTLGAVAFYSTTCNLTHSGTNWVTAHCSVKLHGTTAGHVTIHAAYGGDANNLGGSRTRLIIIH